MTENDSPTPPPAPEPGEPATELPQEHSGGKAKGNDELREFFLRAAELMRLEPKRPESTGAEPKDTATTRGRLMRLLRTPFVRKALLVATAMATVAFALTYTSGSVPIPAAARGVWRTESADYANRRFELGETSLAFQTDDSAQVVTSHVISHVRESQVLEGTLYRVDYLDQPEDTSPLTFEFILATGDNPTIIFANQKKVVWKRVATTAPNTP